jgi:hypothetical protein
MTKFISDKQEHQTKKKQEGKHKLIYYVGNKHWKSMSASSPRISSSQQGLFLAVYLIYLFNGVTTWKGSKQKTTNGWQIFNRQCMLVYLSLMASTTVKMA